MPSILQIGKEQEYQLGTWLRQRYDGFLPADYSELDIRVRSTDVDRTLMSGEACLAGLYPPTPRQLWDGSLKWQPIPIHTVPQTEDAVLSMRKPCPKYDLLLAQLLKSAEFRAINQQLHDLYAYLARYTGQTVTKLYDLESIYNTLFIESTYNFTLPDWTRAVYPAKLEPWAGLSFSVDCYTPAMARLKTGPLFHEIQQHFLNLTNKPKLLLYSAHDETVANVLKTIGAFEPHCPPYSATVIFELYKGTADRFYYLNVLYKNGSEPPWKMVVEGCEFNCPLERFVELMAPVTLPVKVWEKECRVGLMGFSRLSEMGSVILLSCVGTCLVLALGLIVVVTVRRNRARGDTYVRLPDNDVDA